MCGSWLLTLLVSSQECWTMYVDCVPRTKPTAPCWCCFALCKYSDPSLWLGCAEHGSSQSLSTQSSEDVVTVYNRELDELTMWCSLLLINCNFFKYSVCNLSEILNVHLGAWKSLGHVNTSWSVRWINYGCLENKQINKSSFNQKSQTH
jgi:hypothetical protein